MAQSDNFEHLKTSFVIESIQNDEAMYKGFLESAAWMFKYSLNDSTFRRQRLLQLRGLIFGKESSSVEA